MSRVRVMTWNLENLFLPGQDGGPDTEAAFQAKLASLAAVIVVSEGARHLYQLQEHWISHRSTAEALKHERYLYLTRAGPYTGGGPSPALTERIEGLISQEHATWAATSQQPTERPPGQQ
jgi:hypothetical protein